MFLSLLKNRTPYEQIRISGRGKSVQQNGTETPPCLGPKLWNLFPNEYKTIESLEDFKAKIISYAKLCKTCIHQVGFI